MSVADRVQGVTNGSDLQAIAEIALRRGGDFAEVLVETRRNTGVVATNQGVPTVTLGGSRGGSLRLLKNGITYFSSGPAECDSLARMARDISDSSSEADPRTPPALRETAALETRPADLLERSQWLQAWVGAAQAQCPCLTQAVASWIEFEQDLTIVNSLGTCCTEHRLVREVRLSMMGQRAGRTQMVTREIDPSRDDPKVVVGELAHRMRVFLDAGEAPSGEMPVVLGPGCAGVLFHEAIGHSLEADLVQHGASPFAGRVGQQVAVPELTLIDAGNVCGLGGSMHVDDEGTPTRENRLIVAGRLAGHMHSLETARRAGVPATGNGRRQSYLQPPMPRMTNIWVEPGVYAPEEQIGHVRKGLYVEELIGGQTDSTSGQFAFGAIEAYLVHAGRLDRPVRAATIAGRAQDVVRKILMIGNDLQYRRGLCLKGEQMVMTGIGAPTILAEGMIVSGGTP